MIEEGPWFLRGLSSPSASFQKGAATMRHPILTAVLLGLVPTLGASSIAKAQGAVAFQPVVRAFPNGIAMGVTPVVSADRR